MSLRKLDDFSTEYALYPDAYVAPERTAQKLCAPCCYVVAQNPERYCDAIALPGAAYCAEHRAYFADAQRRPTRFFMSLLGLKIPTWWSR